MAVAASAGVILVLMVWEPVTQLIGTVESLGSQAALPDGYTALILKVMGMALGMRAGPHPSAVRPGRRGSHGKLNLLPMCCCYRWPCRCYWQWWR